MLLALELWISRIEGGCWLRLERESWLTFVEELDDQ
jgi:hypothetical protein